MNRKIKIILLTIAILLFGFACGFTGHAIAKATTPRIELPNESPTATRCGIYTTAAQVSYQSPDKQYSLFKDENGDIWKLYGTDYSDNFLYLFWIDTKQTESRFDDEVVVAKIWKSATSY